MELAVGHTIRCQMTLTAANCELEGRRKKRVWPTSNYYTDSCLFVRRRVWRASVMYPGRDSNLKTSEVKSRDSNLKTSEVKSRDSNSTTSEVKSRDSNLKTSEVKSRDSNLKTSEVKSRVLTWRLPKSKVEILIWRLPKSKVEILTRRLTNISQKCLCLSQVSQYKTGTLYPSLRNMF